MKYLVALFLVFSMASAGQKTIITSGLNTSMKASQTTYVNSQVDTVIFTRQAGVSAFSFVAHWKDSVKVDLAVLRRVFNGVVSAVIAGDSLIASTYTSTANGGVTRVISATLQPLPEQYWVIVTYASTGNGVGGDGGSSANVVYGVNASYAK